MVVFQKGENRRRSISPPIDYERVLTRPSTCRSERRFPKVGPGTPYSWRERDFPIQFTYLVDRDGSPRRKGFLRNAVSEFSGNLIYVCFRSTANNLFITVVEPRFGKVLLWISGGRSGFRGPRRTTTSMAEVVSRDLISYLVRNRFFNLAIVYYTNSDEPKVRTAVDNLVDSDQLQIFRYLFKIPFSHNGLRAKKSRRV